MGCRGRGDRNDDIGVRPGSLELKEGMAYMYSGTGKLTTITMAAGAEES